MNNKNFRLIADTKKIVICKGLINTYQWQGLTQNELQKYETYVHGQGWQKQESANGPTTRTAL